MQTEHNNILSSGDNDVRCSFMRLVAVCHKFVWSASDSVSGVGHLTYQWNQILEKCKFRRPQEPTSLGRSLRFP